MTFLALIIAIVLERLTPLEDWLLHDGWFRRWQGQLASLGLGQTLQVVMAVLLPVIAAHLVLEAVRPLLFGLAWIGVAVVVLLYSLGRSNLGAQQERYRSQCRRGDFEAAWLAASAEYDWFRSDDELDAESVHRLAQQGFLYEAYQRWFAVLFYFLLLGPVGALAYRLIHLSCDGHPERQELLFWIDWAPVRLLAAAFTLAGNFVASADELWDALRDPAMTSSSVLYTVALAATGEDRIPAETDGLSGQRAAQQNEIFAALIRRASVCWVTVIAALVILL